MSLNEKNNSKDRIHEWTSLLADIDHTVMLSSDLSRISNQSTESLIVNGHRYRVSRTILALRSKNYN